jgi:ETC complex I subunit-like protein
MIVSVTKGFDVMGARIFRPAPNAMQSGRGKSKNWVLRFEPASERNIDPLMGYTGSTDPNAQIRLNFATLEQAETYARNAGIDYEVEAPHAHTDKQVAYASNFRFDRKTPWTH